MDPSMPFPIDEEHICILESELGAQLPVCYREFMKADNGGTIKLAEEWWELHPIQDTSDRKRISRTSSHVLVENQSYRQWSNAAPHTLSIGEDGGGNRLVLKKSGNTFQPEIYFWHHETGKPIMIASSLADAVRD